MENFNSMLALVKEYITDVWEARKNILPLTSIGACA